MSDDVRQSETKFELGEDLYGVSVAELKQRLQLLQTEISRIEGELAKKQKELSAADQLFGLKT
jgi:uncharacterized small protein (DUF1192 family)